MDLRQMILAADDLPREYVATPEWAAACAGVWVRVMTAAERDAYEASCIERRGDNYERNLANVRAKLVCRCAVDEAGNRIFADADAEALGRKSAAVLDRLYETASRLNRLRAKDAEDLAKN